ncbi:hypothetical protein JTE90_012549 [Oedothorax gibbosus]|uniref:Uncharacterized protein n=1 Tax=Oedothorax gibbosus TaxID=931172 RepID=A0AAV6TGZ6_9ARAC|nr:hypothetical protein JTE90_012549 [Oedothorax gibbosus]
MRGSIGALTGAFGSSPAPVLLTKVPTGALSPLSRPAFSQSGASPHLKFGIGFETFGPPKASNHFRLRRD